MKSTRGSDKVVSGSFDTSERRFVMDAVSDDLWVPKMSSARDDASADPSDPNYGTSVLTR